MKILLINHYAGSPEMGMEFRPYYFGKKWVEMGHEVTIVGASFSHLRAKQPVVANKDVTEQWIDGIRYLWVKTAGYTGNGVGRIKNMMTFVHKLKKHRRLFSEVVEPDVVIASSTYPLDIFPARKIAKLSNAKLVYEVHDLWPLSPMEISGYSKWHPFIMVMQRGEDVACRDSDAVVSLLPRADIHLVERGMDIRKFHWVSNGVVAEDWEDGEPIPDSMADKLEDLHREGRFLIGYAGNHGDANSLESLIDVVKTMEDRKVTAVLLGTGAKKDYFVDKVTREKISNVIFFDPISKKQIPDFLKYMDCLYNGVKQNNLMQFGACFNKVYDYMMASKPIICAATAPNDTVGDARCGYTVNSEDGPALREALEKIMDMDLEEREELGKRGRTAVLEEYEYGKLSKKFMDILSQL
jgi:glycosyltransferase involved in cell wall biosynthesis